MSNEMIDRVAGAIWAANCRVRNDEQQKFDDLSVRSKADLRMYARAAIEAMKIPTEAMELAGDEYADSGAKVWIAMHSAALSEGKGS